MKIRDGILSRVRSEGYSKEYIELQRGFVKTLNAWMDKDIEDVFAIPYVNYFFGEKEGQNRPVIMTPFTEDTEGFMVFIDLKEALDYYFYLDSLRVLGYLVDNIPVVGILSFQLGNETILRRDRQSLRHTISLDWMKQELGTNLCDKIKHGHTDNVVRVWPPLEEELRQRFARARNV